MCDEPEVFLVGFTHVTSLNFTTASVLKTIPAAIRPHDDKEDFMKLFSSESRLPYGVNYSVFTVHTVHSLI